MPWCYCSSRGCAFFDYPQWIEKLGVQSTCKTCGYKTVFPWPTVGNFAQDRVVTKKVDKTVRPRGIPESHRGRAYICQHPDQSGDTTGVGLSLVINPDLLLLFIVANDEVNRAGGYLTFYTDLCVPKTRIVTVVCDIDAEKRPQSVDDSSVKNAEDELTAMDWPVHDLPDGPASSMWQNGDLIALLKKSGWAVTPLVALLRLEDELFGLGPVDVDKRVGRKGRISMQSRDYKGGAVGRSKGALEWRLFSDLEFVGHIPSPLRPFLGLYGVTEGGGNPRSFLVLATDGYQAVEACEEALANSGRVYVRRRADPMVLLEPADPDDEYSRRFERMRELMNIRLTRRHDSARRMIAGSSRFALALPKLKEFAGTIVPWNDEEERGPNQFYIDLVNLGVRTAKGSGLRESYQTLMWTAEQKYSEIGRSTREMLRFLQDQGLLALTKKVAAALQAGCDLVRPIIRESMLPPIGKTLPFSAKGRRLTLVLFWIRGLNDAELASVQKAGIAPSQVTESNFTALDAAKRNPQHVTTAQLWVQIRAFFNLMWRKKFKDRYFHVLPVGDPLKLDMYDDAKGKNLLLSPDPSNLINYWTRDGLKDFGGPHWRYRQFCAVRELFCNEDYDLIQIGIRSGILEQGMYQGVPTIYIEEEFSPTGTRMAQMTCDGRDRAEIDRQFLAALKAAEKSPEDLRKLKLLREMIDDQNETLMTAEGFKTPAVQEAVKVILKCCKNIRGFKRYDKERGYPYFYRLITKHMIGLNQARTRKALDAYEHSVQDLLAGGEETEFDERVYRGGLDMRELKVLERYVREICTGYKDLRKNIHGMPGSTPNEQAPMQLNVIKVPGGGDCLFAAIALGANEREGVQTHTVASVRGVVADGLADRRDEVRAQLTEIASSVVAITDEKASNEAIVEALGPRIGTNIRQYILAALPDARAKRTINWSEPAVDAYILDIRSTQMFGGLLEANTAGQALNHRVDILEIPNRRVNAFDRVDDDPIWLRYNANEGHYDLYRHGYVP